MNGKLLLVLTEVDDLVYTGDQELVDIFEAKLKKKWNIQQSEPLRSFLGININYDREQGTIEFDFAEKIRKLFEEKPWSRPQFQNVTWMTSTLHIFASVDNEVHEPSSARKAKTM